MINSVVRAACAGLVLEAAGVHSLVIPVAVGAVIGAAAFTLHGTGLGVCARAPAATIGLPDGRTAYSFTMFQAPDMPDELFDAQYASLQREFANIEAVFAR